jgi:hypothetical protein
MHTKTVKIFLIVASLMLAASTTASAAVKVITLLSDSDSSTIAATEGDSFTVQITVDSGSEIAGASFTVTYDTNNLTLDEVESSFFGTFADQIVTPESVTVDTETYYSPLVYAASTGGSMLAAARIDNGSTDDTLLFTLTFSATGSSGTYPISVSQSVITNVDAGYTSDPDDEDNLIPFFVGIDGDTYPTHTVSTINAVTVTVSAEFVDTDNNGAGDGIDDNWEIANRPDGVNADDDDVLEYYTATDDYDGDGYSDYQEYLNSVNGETDPDGASYDPAMKNASGGTGYIAPRISLPAVNLLLLQE